LLKIKSGQPITQQAFDSLVNYYRFDELLKKIETGEHFIKKCVRIQKDSPMPFAEAGSLRSASTSSTESEAAQVSP
ncbi:MAG: hypothetical protein K0Q57_1130, partial [Gammaproteobacteria bacterium]|nr:hypothetical protein [Gammaproteobacteria bacterium]